MSKITLHLENMPELSEKIRNRDLELNKGDIEKLVESSNLRDRTFVLLQFTSGMSTIDICKLDYDDFLESISEHLNVDEIMPCNVAEISNYLKNKNNLIGTWHLTRSKTGRTYTTFNSSESTHTILDYLVDRSKDVGFIFQDDPLFVGGDGNKISRDELKLIGSENGSYFRPHHLRKAFVRTLYDQGASKHFVSKLLGHSASFDDIYFKQDMDGLKNTYTKYADCFSLEGKVDLNE